MATVAQLAASISTLTDAANTLTSAVLALTDRLAAQPSQASIETQLQPLFEALEQVNGSISSLATAVNALLPTS